MCKIIISVTFENPCTFENVTELENLETQGLTIGFTPSPTRPENDARAPFALKPVVFLLLTMQMGDEVDPATHFF